MCHGLRRRKHDNIRLASTGSQRLKPSSALLLFWAYAYWAGDIASLGVAAYPQAFPDPSSFLSCRFSAHRFDAPCDLERRGVCLVLSFFVMLPTFWFMVCHSSAF